MKLICVGKLKDASSLCAEYEKRLSAFTKLEICEITEARLSQEPSEAEIKAALDKEAMLIEKAIPNGAKKIALCVEGKELSSEEFAAKLDNIGNVCFIIGGSHGLSDKIKTSADLRLSFSKMTFPHHLFRAMLLEQIYRAFAINTGKRYHK